MPPTGPLAIVDLAEARFRTATIGAGVRLMLFVFGSGVAYAAATLDQPNRALIAVLFGALALGALLVWLLPAERTVRSRFRDLMFLSWSLFSIAVIGAVVAADGGANSPFAVLFFVPAVFAALSYPLASVVAIGVASELTLVLVGSLAGPAEPERLAFSASALALCAVLCAWQAHQHESRRKELTEISRADALTGCLNRRGFEERMIAEIDRGVRQGRPLAVVMLDLDEFKQVNDTHGHAAGDELLRWTVATLKETIRPMDSLGRLGGDEFALVLPGTGQGDALEAADRLREALSSRVSAATGVAAFPAHGVTLDELMRHADAELYAAKDDRGALPSPDRRELSWAAALARAVDLRMADEAEHSNRVAGYAGSIARHLGWDEGDIALLRMAAMLHDVGKVSLPDNILRKPGPLSRAEFDEIKKHPVAGAELIARVDGLEPILPWIRHSHEHFDGSGYPDGLAGEAIPEAARILLVADAFDALTSNRPYRDASTTEEALAEVQRCAGLQFDPACVEALVSHVRSGDAVLAA